jgi:uncharacterized protein (TIGR00369 family)
MFWNPNKDKIPEDEPSFEMVWIYFFKEFLERKTAIFILSYFNTFQTGRTMNYLDKITTQGRSANPFFCLMGIDVVSAAEGKAVLKMTVRPDMYNGVGWLQGGMLAAIADEAMALALYTRLAPGEGIATISESTSFIRGVREGTIVAEAQVIRKGRRVAFMESVVRLEDADNTVLARTTASFAVTVEKS